MALHLFNMEGSASSKALRERLTYTLGLCDQRDTLVVMHPPEGVLAKMELDLNHYPCKVYILAPSGSSNTAPEIEKVTVDDLVLLCAQSPKIKSWY